MVTIGYLSSNQVYRISDDLAEQSLAEQSLFLEWQSNLPLLEEKKTLANSLLSDVIYHIAIRYLAEQSLAEQSLFLERQSNLSLLEVL